MKLLQIIDFLREGIKFSYNVGEHVYGINDDDAVRTIYFEMGSLYVTSDETGQPKTPELFNPLYTELFDDIWEADREGDFNSHPTQLDKFAQYVLEGGTIGRRLPNSQWIFLRLSHAWLEQVKDSTDLDESIATGASLDFSKAGPFDFSNGVDIAAVMAIVHRPEGRQAAINHSIVPMIADFTAEDWQPLFTLEESYPFIPEEVPVEVEEQPTEQVNEMGSYIAPYDVCERLVPLQQRLDGIDYDAIDIDVTVLVREEDGSNSRTLPMTIAIRHSSIDLDFGLDGHANKSIGYTSNTTLEIEKSTILGVINRYLESDLAEIAYKVTVGIQRPNGEQVDNKPGPVDVVEPAKDESPTLPELMHARHVHVEEQAHIRVEPGFYNLNDQTLFVKVLRCDDGEVQLTTINGKFRGQASFMSAGLFVELFEAYSGPIPGVELDNGKGMRVIVRNRRDEHWICLLDVAGIHQPIALSEKQLEDFKPTGFNAAVDIVRFDNPFMVDVD